MNYPTLPTAARQAFTAYIQARDQQREDPNWDELDAAMLGLREALEASGPAPPPGETNWEVQCIECRNDGRYSVCEHRLGAWFCPVHRDSCHVDFVQRTLAGGMVHPVRAAERAFEALAKTQGFQGGDVREAVTELAQGLASLARQTVAHDERGLHRTMGWLFAMGEAVGLVKPVLPRELWDALPGGMPYYQVLDAE